MIMDITDRLRAFPGRIGFYYHPLGGTVTAFNADIPFEAASVIKIPVMISAFRAIRSGELDAEMSVTVPREAKLPSCGALTYLHDGLSVTVMDLITLMIILSDNTATNMLIDMLGMERVNEDMRALGIKGVSLVRKLFDAEAAARGLENRVTARGIGEALYRMQTGTLLGGEADAGMLGILMDQRLNGKMPFFLHSRGIRCAHKTGEDAGITHDVGIVYTRTPFVLCMLGNEVDVPAFERLIQDTALALALRNNDIPEENL